MYVIPTIAAVVLLIQISWKIFVNKVYDILDIIACICALYLAIHFGIKSIG